MAQFDVSSEQGLAAFNEFMSTRSYVSGHVMDHSKEAAIFSKFEHAPCADTYPHASRWYNHVVALARIYGCPIKAGAACTAGAETGTCSSNQETKGKKAEGKKPKAQKAPTGQHIASEPSAAGTTPPAATEPAKDEKPVEAAKPVAVAAKPADDEMDMFGDDDDDAPVAAAKPVVVASTTAKKEKKKEVERSLLVLEVKPYDTETDLPALWVRITTTIAHEGLTWGQGYELRPVAYGVQKLVMSCVIINDLVLMDDVTEPIEALDEMVQSVEVQMSRL